MKRVLITGATSGHGLELARRLSADHQLLVHGRDRKRTEELAVELDARPLIADLSDLEQVRQMAKGLLAGGEKIDILINNAGIGYAGERELSRQGFELRWTVMYLAPVLLTHLLLPLITSQVLNIGSKGQESLDFENLDLHRDYSGLSAYRRSKLALAMFTFDLAEEQPRLRVNVSHPATYMNTKMVLQGGGTPINTVEHGVNATLRVLESDLTRTFFDEDQPAKAHADADDPELRARLRQWTREALKL